jgi:hypothetical protein
MQENFHNFNNKCKNMQGAVFFIFIQPLSTKNIQGKMATNTDPVLFSNMTITGKNLKFNKFF